MDEDSANDANKTALQLVANTANNISSPAADELSLLNYHFNVKVLPEKFSYKNASFQICPENQVMLEEVTASDICFRGLPIKSDENGADTNLAPKFYVISEVCKAIQQSESKMPRVLMLCQSYDGFKCFLAENYSEKSNPQINSGSEAIVNKIDSKCDPLIAARASNLTESDATGSELVEVGKETCESSINLDFKHSQQNVISRPSGLHKNLTTNNNILPSEMCPNKTQDKDTKLQDQRKTYFFTCSIS